MKLLHILHSFESTEHAYFLSVIALHVTLPVTDIAIYKLFWLRIDSTDRKRL